MSAELSGSCVRCNYDLTGIANDAPCSECGLLAERSRRPSEQLRDSDPRFLRRLSGGIWLMLLSFAIAPLWIVANVIEQAFRLLPRSMTRTEHLLLAGMDASAIVFLLSVILLTSPERGQKQRKRCWAIRLLAVLPLFCFLVGHATPVLQEMFWQINRPVWPLAALPTAAAPTPSNPALHHFLEWGIFLIPWLQMGLAVTVLLIFPPIFFFHLRDLGRRLLSRQIAEHSVIVGIGLSLTTLIAVGVGVWMTSPMGGQAIMGLTRREQNQLLVYILTGFGAAAGLLGLWTLFLLARLGIAFAKEAYQLHSAWRRADKASPDLDGQRFSY